MMPSGKARPKARRDRFREEIVAGRRRKAVPHEFVLEALAPLEPMTRSMFGCLAIYVEEKIVLILRERHDSKADNGVWLATTAEHHASLQRDFPRMRSIRIFAQKVTHWQVLPTDDPDFEEAALRACAFIRAHDPRIGKIPRRRSNPSSRAGSRPHRGKNK
jgi:hypothetical protein